jgi:nucleotide-binding universal stress UspA family protein
MHILVCSDGTAPADYATHLAGLLAESCQAEVTLLGIEENPIDKEPLRAALEKEAESLRARGLSPQIVVRAGEPIRQIFEQTNSAKYDLAVIGARGKGAGGLYWRSQKTYELIKTIEPPVLVVPGQCERLKRFLVCTGGKQFIENTVALTVQLAKCAGASVTLLHVMAEPPIMYADLTALEEDVEQLMASGSELGRNLLAQKESIEKLGVPAEVRVRHGMVLDQVFQEVQEGDYDLIATGSSRARGMVRHYIMGDVTRGILNHANIPVLVARSESVPRNLFQSLKHLFGSSLA